MSGQNVPQFLPKYIARAEKITQDYLTVVEENPSSHSLTIEGRNTGFDIHKLLTTEITAQKGTKLRELHHTFSNSIDAKTRNESNVSQIKHKINTGSHPPISQRPYRVSTAERRIIREEENNMLRRRSIQPYQSPRPSTVVLASKKDESWPFCTDYRRLNNVTKYIYTLRTMNDTLGCLIHGRTLRLLAKQNKRR